MAADFRPFLTASKTPGETGSQPAFAAAVATPAAAVASAAKPCAKVNVELKRDGNRITQIRVHCRCGEVIELACDYQ